MHHLEKKKREWIFRRQRNSFFFLVPLASTGGEGKRDFCD
jgi:hypothetical protein